jgi:hypothetical protein
VTVKADVKQCFVCGVVYKFSQYGFWRMSEVRAVHLVSDHNLICSKCGDKANSFINYWGKKKPKDLAKLHNFLASGILPMRQYQQQMNAGYFS